MGAAKAKKISKIVMIVGAVILCLGIVTAITISIVMGQLRQGYDIPVGDDFLISKAKQALSGGGQTGILDEIVRQGLSSEARSSIGKVKLFIFAYDAKMPLIIIGIVLFIAGALGNFVFFKNGAATSTAGAPDLSAVRDKASELGGRMKDAAKSLLPMHCPGCGKNYSVGTKFCKECGTALVLNEPAPSQPAGVVCPSCGKRLSKDAIFCSECGASITKAKPSAAPSPAIKEASSVTPSPVAKLAPVSTAPVVVYSPTAASSPVVVSKADSSGEAVPATAPRSRVARRQYEPPMPEAPVKVKPDEEARATYADTSSSDTNPFMTTPDSI